MKQTGGTNLKIKQWLKIAAMAGLLFLSAAGARSATAATLYFSPAVGSKAVGSTFTVTVYVNSTDQSMNAASGMVFYPNDLLEATALSKSGSIFSLWVDEPTFSQAAGTLHFEGVVMNPGYKGSAGKIIAITFKVKAAGDALLRFRSGSVLANNGIGTNILSSLGSAEFTLTGGVPPKTETTSEPAKTTQPPPASEPKAVEPPENIAGGLPPLPIISSVSHPNQEIWYNAKQAQFSWTLSRGVTAVSLLFGQNSSADPTIIYEPPITTKTVEDLNDGIWYFSARFKNSAGWSDTARYRLQIDTTPPANFAVNFVNGQDISSQRPIISFGATDALSGIDRYRIRVIGDNGIEAGDEVQSDNPYLLPPQRPGQKTVFVQAFDKAGNYTTAIADFEAKGLAAPVIDSCPGQLTEGQRFTLAGSTLPASKVEIWVKHDNDVFSLGETTSDDRGNFKFSYPQGLAAGVYSLWAEAQNQQGERTYPSTPYEINVKSSVWRHIPVWFYIVLLAAVGVSLLGLAVVLFFQKKHKLSVSRRHTHKTVIAFTYLKNIFRTQIKLLKRAQSKRRLTGEEKIILTKDQKDLTDVEAALKKETGRVTKGR